MAKTTITRSCGHTETVNICGPYAGRERQAQYEATKLCRTCWQAKIDAEKAQANTAAAESAQTAGRPELTGTEKQVAWATTIREAKLADLAILVDRVRANVGGEMADITDAVAARIEAQTSASYWIDNKDLTPPKLVKAAMTEPELQRLAELSRQ